MLMSSGGDPSFPRRERMPEWALQILDEFIIIFL